MTKLEPVPADRDERDGEAVPDAVDVAIAEMKQKIEETRRALHGVDGAEESALGLHMATKLRFERQLLKTYTDLRWLRRRGWDSGRGVPARDERNSKT
ncbi:MAG: hypothetical protein HY907_06025 [Deltaproteobacteria bacterium]|nr:hypothetical protein [Deltaproteobacteria bacterium]